MTEFMAALFLITLAELGDKTFCIGMLLATRYPRRLVFLGVFLALIVMTVLSIIMGRATSFLPRHWVRWGEISLFVGFGIKMLYEAWHTPVHVKCSEMDQATEAVNQKSWQWGSPHFSIVLQSFILTFFAEWGDRTQFSTMALASGQNSVVGVTLGAIAGHGICAALAVISGRWVAGRLSERWLLALTGVLFLVFAAVAWSGI